MADKTSKLDGISILLGVSGGIAAYKAVALASTLTAGGVKVRCVMTKNACELIGPKSFEAVTGQQVFTSLWNGPDYKPGHISLTQGSDIVVVAPATANIIGKVTSGICDDLLSTVLCACWSKPVLFAPAMNDNMWNNPAVQKNISTLKEMGIRTTGPQKGRLACGTEGVGRMTEPDEIIKEIEKIAADLN